ncbi:hypothetical protein WMY93_027627 [Mugilogobius chulae]|uniref:G-protein coupled receptors family 1 profile domain-containing protein n=1 Tax=Mugilogobius chulae TaxID=88201 RepID=A0AAW0N079_9GOBI
MGTDVFLGFWPFGKTLCKAVVSIDYYNMFTSTFTLTVMSMDRYVAVCHPVKALDMRTPHKAKVVNICVWVLASAFGVPAMVMGNVEEEQEHNNLSLAPEQIETSKKKPSDSEQVQMSDHLEVASEQLSKAVT